MAFSGGAAAAAAANDAITFSRRSLQGMYEVIAQGVLARARLRRDGPATRAGAEKAFMMALEIVERTGARALAPPLLEWRAELSTVLGDHASCNQLRAAGRRRIRRDRRAESCCKTTIDHGGVKRPSYGVPPSGGGRAGKCAGKNFDHSGKVGSPAAG